MEAGMDSLSAVEFRNRLSNELPGIKLPNTLIFDYPTVSAIGSFALKVKIAPLCARYCFTGWCFMKLPSILALVKLMDVPFLVWFCLKLASPKSGGDLRNPRDLLETIHFLRTFVCNEGVLEVSQVYSFQIQTPLFSEKKTTKQHNCVSQLVVQVCSLFWKTFSMW